MGHLIYEQVPPLQSNLGGDFGGDYRSTYKAIASWTITTASRDVPFVRDELVCVSK